MNYPKRIIPEPYMRQLISEGRTNQEISEITKLPYGIVLANAKRYGLKAVRAKIPLTALTSEQMAQLEHLYHDKKMSGHQIATLFGTNQTAVWTAMKRLGLKTRPVDGDYRKYRLNETYFDQIDTEEKAYWLGFLYADGNMSYCHTKKGTRYNIRLSQVLSDVSILERFRDALYPDKDKPITVTKSNGGYNSPNRQAYVDVYSKKMFGALERLGCEPRKSFTARFPTPDQVPDYLLRHFVRGYFDGDGCITYGTCKKCVYKQIKGNVGMVGSRDFILTLADKLRDIVDTAVGTLSFKHSPKCYRVLFGAKSSISTFYRYIYQDATVWLSRKRDKFDSYFRDMKMDNPISNDQP